eukprot:2493978-Prymnesium_polylepis.1
MVRKLSQFIFKRLAVTLGVSQIEGGVAATATAPWATPPRLQPADAVKVRPRLEHVRRLGVRALSHEAWHVTTTPPPPPLPPSPPSPPLPPPPCPLPPSPFSPPPTPSGTLASPSNPPLPASPVPPSASPPPPSPTVLSSSTPPQPTTPNLRLGFTLAGSVDSFNLSTFGTRLATALGVPESRLFLVVQGASVRVIAIVTAPDVNSVEALRSDVQQLYLSLGSTLDVTIEALDASVVTPLGVTSVQSISSGGTTEGEGASDGISSALLIALSVGGFALVVGAAVLWRVLIKQRPRTRPSCSGCDGASKSSTTSAVPPAATCSVPPSAPASPPNSSFGRSSRAMEPRDESAHDRLDQRRRSRPLPQAWPEA